MLELLILGYLEHEKVGFRQCLYLSVCPSAASVRTAGPIMAKSAPNMYLGQHSYMHEQLFKTFRKSTPISARQKNTNKILTGYNDFDKSALKAAYTIYNKVASISNLYNICIDDKLF